MSRRSLLLLVLIADAVVWAVVVLGIVQLFK